MDKEHFGTRVLRARNAMSLSQEELGKRVGAITGGPPLRGASISAWEAGNVKTIAGDVLLALCEIFSASPQWIVHGTGNPPPCLVIGGGTPQQMPAAAEPSIAYAADAKQRAQRRSMFLAQVRKFCEENSWNPTAEEWEHITNIVCGLAESDPDEVLSNVLALVHEHDKPL